MKDWIGAANFSYALLANTRIVGVDLRRVNLRRANLKGADLAQTDFRDANLMEADMSGARLISAQLDGANVKGANLMNANLIFAKVSGVDWLTSSGAIIEANKWEVIESEQRLSNIPVTTKVYTIHRKKNTHGK